MRGINGQQIFEEQEDYDKFLQIIKDYKSISGYKVYSYCLMGNHVHLLMQEGIEPISLFMKRIATKFVYWCNIKYQRIGHLFQDRFKSEPVDSDDYFLTVLRYIHQNPVKAGLCKSIELYKNSSYNELFPKSDFIDNDFIFGLVPSDELKKFIKYENTDNCLDIDDKLRAMVTDEQAQYIIECITKCKNVSEFQKLEVEILDKYLKKLREQGLSIRQISRLTGVSINVVRKF